MRSPHSSWAAFADWELLSNTRSGACCPSLCIDEETRKMYCIAPSAIHDDGRMEGAV